MEDIVLFNRLVAMATRLLGSNFTSDLAKLTAVVMTFVESEIPYVISSSEKLVLFENYFKRLVSSSQLGGLEAETMTLIKSFVGLICKASKGQLAINSTTPATPVVKDSDANSLPGTGRKKSFFKRS